ncbi:MAG: recombinase family protein, partial [Deltaproteobacteria bacterium]|nr:recombinase family protein [Deltaproteobacteria bacterium]
MSNKFFLYARKSMENEERQALSIESQLVEVREHAAKEKVTIVREFTEAMTAKSPGRPVFDEMLSCIAKGEADGIIAWHPDRLARNSLDGGRIIHFLDIGHLKALKFCTLWFENTPQGKFMLNMAFGQSKYYVDNLSENVKRGQRQKLRRGEWPFGPPLGYLGGGRYSFPKVDPVKGPLITKLFEAYASGRTTLKQLRELCTSWGLVSRSGKKVALAKVHATLLNPFYYGLVRYKDDCAQGVHEPLVSKELFDRVQETLKRRGKPNKVKKHHFSLVGLAKCATCGGAITAERKKGHAYYHCTKKLGPCSEKKYLREEPFAQQIKEALQTVALPDDSFAEALTTLGQMGLEASQPVNEFKKELDRELPQLKVKQDRLLHAHLEGLIDKGEYRSAKKELVDREMELRTKLAHLEGGVTGWLEPAQNFIRAAHHAGLLAGGENLEAQKEFLKKIGSNFRVGGRRLSFQFKNPWAFLGG